MLYSVSMKKEEWRSVVGYEGLYEVSDAGRVRRLIFRNNRATFVYKTPRIMSARQFGKYLGVSLYDGRGRGARKNRYVHHMVAEAFIGPRPTGYEVAHLDGKADNNSSANLTYATKKTNMAHQIEHGTAPVGSRHGMAKLTEKEVLEMRSLRGKTHEELAKVFGVSVHTAKKVIKRETWTHV